MKMRFSQLLISFILTLILLIGFEIITSSILPIFGWKEYRMTFNVLIILFLAIRLDSPVVPWLILLLQLVHSVFSIEGWALGTFAGLIVLVSANYLKELLHLTTAVMTMLTVQFFQFVWFLTVTVIICLKVSDFNKFGMIFWNFIPGSLLLSIVSPFLFYFLGKIWRVSNEGSPGGVEI